MKGDRAASGATISVVTVCLNAERTIEDTIRSVAAQDWADFEHIIVDGGSTDGTAALVERLRHDRLRFVSGHDDGLYDAMNKGLHLATGDYVGFLNADDFLAAPDALGFIARAAESGADCILGDTALVDSDGRPTPYIYSARGFRSWWLTIGAMPPHPSFYARRALLLAAGGFDISFRVGADFDLIARLILGRGARWLVAGRILTCFRQGGVSTQGLESIRRISADKQRSIRALGYSAAPARTLLRFPLRIWRRLNGVDRWPKSGIDVEWLRRPNARGTPL
ncbi:MAG: glycosyltransferase [Alphaproteobacteria bacterium]|nr:MAG: glycosyltransferase [Alphaproteobacteria bacterium]